MQVVTWTDEYTPVDGLTGRASDRKYGAVCASIINLEAQVRFIHDFILLLLVYNAKGIKKVGGLNRLLTGKGGDDGKEYHDGISLAVELERCRTESIMVELPDDDKPGCTKIWRLRIYLLMVTFDWLASGDFGPFASSVAARYPCFKCMWTKDCECAYKPSTSITEVHGPHCRRHAKRTHNGTMAAVEELRAYRGSAAGLHKLKTDTGIFHLHFPSEHLMSDVIRDAMIDMMHVMMCGMTRYLLSWLTDLFIPHVFTWEMLDARKRAYKFGRGRRVPKLKRTQGSPRDQKQIHLTGGEAMDFALARCERARTTEGPQRPLACSACMFMCCMPSP